MNIRLVIDAQLPPAFAVWLGKHGFAAKSARELGLRDSDDGTMWNFAISGNWTLVTKDEDFVDRSFGDPNAPTIIWLRIGNCTNPVLFKWFEQFIPEIKSRLARGEKLIELR